MSIYFEERDGGWGWGGIRVGLERVLGGFQIYGWLKVGVGLV